MHLSNYGLSMMGLCFGIVSTVVYGLSRNAVDFYIAGGIDAGFSIYHVAHRAILMNLVDQDEAGKSNAIIGAAEGALYHLWGSLYSYIYSHTLEVYAAAYYFVSASCFTYSLVAVIGMFLIQRAVDRKGER